MKLESLPPVFVDNYVTIAMSSSDEYLPYLTVCLQSLIDNSNNSCNYDIIIFTSSKDNDKKEIIKNHFSKENISIRFYNPKNILKNINLKITHSYFNEACFYRVVSPLVLNKYKKIIFTDIDLIFRCDIKELYSIDIDNYPMAACKEPIWTNLIDNNFVIKGIKLEKYAKETLKLNDIKLYYNTGVVIFNIDEFNKNDYVNKLLNLIDKNYFIYQEQCALNCLFNDNIFTLEPNWNGEVNIEGLYDNPSLENANIIHYLSQNKPWYNPGSSLNLIWWQYARKTPFYEQILQIMIDRSIQTKINQKISAKINYIKSKIDYMRCRLLQNLTFGKTRSHYYHKKDYLKHQINLAKTIK